jgi:hypothetical protein
MLIESFRVCLFLAVLPFLATFYFSYYGVVTLGLAFTGLLADAIEFLYSVFFVTRFFGVEDTG